MITIDALNIGHEADAPDVADENDQPYQPFDEATQQIGLFTADDEVGDEGG